MDRPEVIDDYKWIAVHTYSGYENKVAENILKIAESRQMRNQIVETCVPKETVQITKIKKEKIYDAQGKVQRDGEGKIEYREIKEHEDKVVVKYPSYVFVKVGVVYEEKDGAEEMKLTDVAWYIIRNTRGVTGFIGPNKKPSALSQAEVEQFGLEEKIYETGFEVGDTVRIIFGDFKDFTGVVNYLNPEEDCVKVTVPLFMGQDTSVELTLDCVVPVED